MRNLNYKTTAILALMVLAIISTSCFKEEPLNAECDIEQAWVHVNDLEASFYNANDTLINVLSNENKVVFTMRDDADVTAFAPQFKITAGATITPASGSAHDFSDGPVTYTVTSEDG
ncbi:MAG: glycoside hydrolase xylanase, partial [Muribaculaceae bacterium]|nr:glycoside hydrolase xylanase [Muribaculaceae bacterium]